jgi:hypothetical protein
MEGYFKVKSFGATGNGVITPLLFRKQKTKLQGEIAKVG